MIYDLKTNMRLTDILAYILLIGGLIIGAFSYLSLDYDANSQFLLVLLMAVFYVFWGALYHAMRQDLTARLFREYLVLAAIVSVVGFLVLVI